MENKTENAEGINESALLKSLAIAIPEAKINEYGIGFMVKITTKKIDPVQFSNLASIATIYNRDIDIIPFRLQLVITLSERLERKNIKPNENAH